MPVDPLHLQNLFLRSDQLSKELAQQAQASRKEQDAAAEKLVRQTREQDAQVHKVKKQEHDTLQVDDESEQPSSGTDEHTEEEKEGEKESEGGEKGEGGETISEDYIGKRIDIRQ